MRASMHVFCKVLSASQPEVHIHKTQLNIHFLPRSKHIVHYKDCNVIVVRRNNRCFFCCKIHTKHTSTHTHTCTYRIHKKFISICGLGYPNAKVSDTYEPVDS